MTKLVRKDNLKLGVGRKFTTAKVHIYSSHLSFSNSCALGRSLGSKVKHLRKNPTTPGISFSSTTSRDRKKSSRGAGLKSSFVRRSMPKQRR